MSTPTPLAELEQLSQKHYEKPIEIFVIGEESEPLTTVKIVLPTGKEFTAQGKNKEEATQNAAVEALKTF